MKVENMGFGGLNSYQDMSDRRTNIGDFEESQVRHMNE